MKEFIVKASDLYDVAKQIKTDNMTYVKLEFLDAEYEKDGTRVPPCVLLQAICDTNHSKIVDYEYVDVVENINF